MTMIGLDAFVTSFEESMRESEFYTPDPEAQRQYQENKASMAYINAAAPTSIIILVVILIITMVIKTQTKILGIILIVVAVTELILTSAFGVLPLALLLPAGILAIRWKPPRSESTQTQRVDYYSTKGEDSIVGRTGKTYCRYCGKQRDASGEYCSICGRSLHSSSTALKKCTNCESAMSEDSEFCANCGQKFEKKTNTTEGTKRFYYTSDGKKVERT